MRNKAIYLALGVLPDGTREILGIWIENTEGAKFWLKVFNDLKTRGVGDILIAVTDGLKGIPEALGAAFPATTLQTCIVHLIRNSLEYASWKDRKVLARRCGRSTPQSTQKQRWRPWRTLNAVPGASGIRPSRRSGVAPGIGSFRSLPSPPAVRRVIQTWFRSRLLSGGHVLFRADHGEVRLCEGVNDRVNCPQLLDETKSKVGVQCHYGWL